MFKRFLAFIVIFCLTIPPAMAEGLNSSDLNFAFGSSSQQSNYKIGDVVYMTEEQMLATEGEWIPVVVAAARVAYSGYKAYKAYKKVNKATKTAKALGKRKNWVRVKPSYSKAGGFKTKKSITFGSNKKYQKEIGNKTARKVNNGLRNVKIPGRGWRTADRGHFHLRR